MDETDNEIAVINLSSNDESTEKAPEKEEEEVPAEPVEPEADSVDKEARSAEESGAEGGSGEKDVEANGNEADADGNEVEEDNPFGDDVDSDEEGGGVQVTIRKIEAAEKPAVRQGKLDLDATVTINDKPIYDLNLARAVDCPWRKPGADITDYFNYGFNDETWNLYCERQKKLRKEFSGNQQQANNSLMASITLSDPLAPVISNTGSVVKVLTDNGGRFKQNQFNSTPAPMQNDQIIRTVITGASSTPNLGNPAAMQNLVDFSRPPPGMNLPSMNMAPPVSMSGTSSDAPPGVDGNSDRPPGVEGPPGASGPPGLGVPGVPGSLDMHLGIPSLGFNPNMPPPGMPPMGLMGTNMPPHGFNMPPPAMGGGFPQHSRAGFNTGIPPGGSAPRSLMPQASYSSRDISDEDDERRSSRRKRSRSRSPRRGDRDRDSRRRGERESDRTSSRRHRSRSTSGDRRRRRDERERDKRRDRRDADEDRSKKSSRRRDEDDERRDSSGKKEKSSSSRSRGQEDEESTGASSTAGAAVEASPVD